MPAIEVYTDQGVKLATYPEAAIGGVDLADTPMASDYVEIVTPAGAEEFHGRIVVRVITPKGEKDGEG
jgi:hypothetical protein